MMGNILLFSQKNILILNKSLQFYSKLMQICYIFRMENAGQSIDQVEDPEPIAGPSRLL